MLTAHPRTRYQICTWLMDLTMASNLSFSTFWLFLSIRPYVRPPPFFFILWCRLMSKLVAGCITFNFNINLSFWIFSSSMMAAIPWTSFCLSTVGITNIIIFRDWLAEIWLRVVVGFLRWWAFLGSCIPVCSDSLIDSIYCWPWRLF